MALALQSHSHALAHTAQPVGLIAGTERLPVQFQSELDPWSGVCKRPWIDILPSH